MENNFLLAISCLALSVILATSPLILLGGGSEVVEVTSADLTTEQISKLQSLDLARNPADSREGKTTISDVKLVEGTIVIAGVWEDGAMGFENQTNRGGKDGFIASIDASGEIGNLTVFGSAGDDSILVLEVEGSSLIVRGFTPGTIDYEGGELQEGSRTEAFEGRLDQAGWIGFWHIDAELLRSLDERIWCGF